MTRAPVRALLILVLAMSGALATMSAGASTLSDLQSEIVTANATAVVPAHTTPALVAVEPTSTFSIPSLLWDCTPGIDQTSEPLCTYGDTTASTTVVLYGNSEAQAWAPAFDKLGAADKFKVIVIAKPACGTLLDSGYLGPENRVGTTCYRFAEWAIKRINAIDPALLVIATTPGNVLKSGTNPRHFSIGAQVPSRLVVAVWPSRTATDLAAFLAATKVDKSDVVVLGAIPTTYAKVTHAATPSACLLAHLTSMPSCAMATPTVATSEWESALSEASTRSDVTLIDVSALMCAGGRCPLVVHDTLVHFNTIHISSAFADLAAPALAELIGSALP